MLVSIQSLRGFGIFDEYQRPAGTHDFCDRNVIYGWNYSGKTTLSRLFHAINERAPHAEVLGCKFAVASSDGGVINEANVAACTKRVRVFNSDFVSESLNWNGGAFKPILLLGDEAIDAQKKITYFEKVIARCTVSAARRRQEARTLEDALSEAKTATAKQIKTALGLVEPFTAVHLNQSLTTVSLLDDTNHTVPPAALAADISLANSSERDKLPLVPELAVPVGAEAAYGAASVLLQKQPASSRLIDALVKRPAVAAWVADGIHLHHEADKCEFCLNSISPERRADLAAHFSKEHADYISELEKLLLAIRELRVDGTQVREADLNVQFRPRLAPLLTDLNKAVTAYREWTSQLESLCKQKNENHFASLPTPSAPTQVMAAVTAAIKALNSLIAESNLITTNFGTEKGAAIKRLKNHFAYQFAIDFKIDETAEKASFRLKEAQRFDKAKEQALVKLNEQKARINRAQNGREKINERIVSLLNSSSLQIDLINEANADQFILKRNGKIARHLSEGEKTAISFAFFLTKLLEEPKLEEVIVYIDDPISSLDSNHIFQVYSILKNVFFTKTPNQKGFSTTCQQLFVSTHNFEFFSLLRDLPGEPKYFMTKRISPTRSTLVNLPESISRYPSEYHYLFHILHKFHESPDKADTEHLLSLPNAARRFVELYTYSRLPMGRNSKVEVRAGLLFGPEKAHRILKVLHHFSHLESVERLMTNTNAVADIEGAVSLLMECLKEDVDHYKALCEAVK